MYKDLIPAVFYKGQLKEYFLSGCPFFVWYVYGFCVSCMIIG